MTENALGFEILLILALIVLNGVFAMSEIAVVSSRKARLQQRSAAGDAGARRALELAEHPTRFLSTVQIGITLIGVFAGAYGGARIAGQLDAVLARFPPIAAYSEEIALAAVVAVITFLSLVIGELVPKRIALNAPERIASLVAGPMDRLSVLATPLVRLLSASTDFLLRLLRAAKPEEPPVTEEEVAAMLDVGTAAGVFEEEEHDLVERVFWLGDQRVRALMTPRNRIGWLDVGAPAELHRRELVRLRHSRYLVCDGDLDRVLGMVRVQDLLADLVSGRPIDLRAPLRQPLFVPDSLRALVLLDMFRDTGVHLAVVRSEHGAVDGLITLNDVVEEITGSLAGPTEPRVVQRDDGTWLVDASLTMDRLWTCLGLAERRGERRRDSATVGGLVVARLGRIPRSGDAFEAHDFRFEVVDMDGSRVDKVLVSPLPGGARGADRGAR